MLSLTLLQPYLQALLQITCHLSIGFYLVKVIPIRDVKYLTHAENRKTEVTVALLTTGTTI